ncbi:hypothetical protein [Fructilactobacillus sanfranciscensis]|uniref:hypothetical protein n=1 Tax=Fructilactobacillus sanfranciscensis TaxID=1625 RepID=UPI00111A84F2|nr:hypothetical protein [Fructilactobacillus sanfranciscensis]TNK96809.1 hypothetical protein DKP75_06695 [Fructilactobacillus sanfranciscensis]
MKRFESFFKYFMKFVVIGLVIIAIKNITTIYQQSMAKNMTETPRVEKSDIESQSVKQKVLIVFFKPNTELEKKLKPKLQDYLTSITLQQRPRVIYVNSKSQNGRKLEKQYDVNDYNSCYLLPISNKKVQEKINGESIQAINSKLLINNQINDELLKSFINGNWGN